MEFEVRELKTSEELDACIALQKEIWGLDDASAMSPITLKALTTTNPPVGHVLGAYHGERMIGLAVTLGTLAPDVGYGHMVGVLDEYRNHVIGRTLLRTSFETLAPLGIREVVWTYDPLVGRNAQVYINHLGAYGSPYYEDYYHARSSMNDWDAMDRLLLHGPLDYHPAPDALPTLEQALEQYPVATPGDMPDVDAVLLEVPADIEALKNENLDEAKRFRMETRTVFSEYINRRGFRATGFVTGKTPQGRKSYYILTRA